MLKPIVIIFAFFILSAKVCGQVKAFASASVNIVSSEVGIETTDTLSKAILFYREGSVLNSHEKTFNVRTGKPSVVENFPIASFTIIGDAYVYDITIPIKEIGLTTKTGKGLIKTSFSINQLKKSSRITAQRNFVLEAALRLEQTQPKGEYRYKEPLPLIVNFN